MFTPSMTNEEIEAVAYKDFLEIRGRVEIAKDKFVQRVRCTPPGFWALHSLQETHTLQTRSKNTWTVYFYYLYTTPAGAVKVSSMIYQIQLNGLLPAIYFMRTAGDRKIAPYTPDTWTEEEKKDKYLFVSEQGTMEAKLEGRVETYLTFLEPEQPGD